MTLPVSTAVNIKTWKNQAKAEFPYWGEGGGGNEGELRGEEGQTEAGVE